jgi:hypothetical protein
MRRLTTNLLPCLLVLAACGGSSNPEKDAYAAMGSGNFSAAVGYFDQALEGMDEADGKYIGLVVGKCEAMAATDAVGARDLFLATAATHELTVRDYGMVVSRLVEAKAFDPAIDILAQGKEAFPGEEKVDKMAAIVVSASQKAGDAGAMDRLKGLGYL